MNQITFPRISYDGSVIKQSDLESWYCLKVEGKIRFKLNKIVTTNLTFCEKRTLTWIIKCLHSILLSSPQWQKRVVGLVDKYGVGLFWHKSNNNHFEKTDFGKKIYNAFNYDGYRSNELVLLAEKLNIKSCPYCNMHYTLFAEEGKYLKDKITKFQFDHFYDKAEYPFLSMSLYNLIPSCGICNQGKSTDKLALHFHPYASSINRQFHFEVPDPLELYSGAKKDKIEVELLPDASTAADLKKYNETFHIQMLYRRHGDIAQEVFDKAYEEAYYMDANSFKYISQEASDYLMRLTYGTYIDEKDIEKRPMSKFIQDMRKQAISCKTVGNVLRKN